MMLKTFLSDTTFIISNSISLYSPYFPNCQCRLVAISFPTVTQPDFGASIPWFFDYKYELISYISEPHNIYYIIRKVSHQFGKKVHDQVHHYATTLEIEPANSFMLFG